MSTVTEKPIDAQQLTPAQVREHEHYEAIKEKAAEVRSAREEWAAAKDKTKSKKAAFDELNAELIKMIDDGPDLQHKLPLKDPNEEPAWRNVKCDQLDIKPRFVTTLAEHGIETLGQLSDFWRDRNDLTDLAGIGEATAAAISDAFSDYGTAHPEIFGQQPAEQAGELAETEQAALNMESEGSPPLGVVSDEEDDDEDDELVEDWDDDEDEDEDEDL